MYYDWLKLAGVIIAALVTALVGQNILPQEVATATVAVVAAVGALHLTPPQK